ncbi:MAG: hypothetical protein JO026_01240 [Patescibacteria group bacterium]|nr:hypothetical protein [Patescibacteria group bacterium]
MPEKSLQKPESHKTDWFALFKYSYLFSQGSSTTQKKIFDWLANGPLNGMTLPPTVATTLKRKLLKHVHALIAHGEHAREVGGAALSAQDFETIDREVEYFQSSLEDAPKKNPTEFQKATEQLTSALLEQDLHWRTGRPVNSARRGKYSSYVIDFGILKKGDGLYKYKDLPPELQAMWDAVIADIQRAGNADKRYEEVAEEYLARHPDLRPKDALQIKEFLDKVKRADEEIAA